MWSGDALVAIEKIKDHQHEGYGIAATVETGDVLKTIVISHSRRSGR